MWITIMAWPKLTWLESSAEKLWPLGTELLNYMSPRKRE